MPRLLHDSGSFEYTVVRTRRRTLAIHIDPAKGVVVRAPRLARDKAISDFLRLKAPWVNRKLAEMRQRAAEAPRHTFLDGDVFLFRGETYALKVLSGPGAAVELAGPEIILRPGDWEPREVLRKWYVARAREALNRRVSFYSGELGERPARVAVRGQSRRWGSCSAKGNLNLNWKLVMAPPEILDYVVAHEVCHLLHPDHGKEFWRALGRVMPDYAAHRDWLKRNGHRLGL